MSQFSWSLWNDLTWLFCVSQPVLSSNTLPRFENHILVCSEAPGKFITPAFITPNWDFKWSRHFQVAGSGEDNLHQRRVPTLTGHQKQSHPFTGADFYRCGVELGAAWLLPQWHLPPSMATALWSDFGLIPAGSSQVLSLQSSQQLQGNAVVNSAFYNLGN